MARTAFASRLAGCRPGLPIRTPPHLEEVSCEGPLFSSGKRPVRRRFRSIGDVSCRLVGGRLPLRH